MILVDRGDPVENPGSTSHAPGGVVALSHNKLLTQLAVYSSRLYASLEPLTPERRMVNRLGFWTWRSPRIAWPTWSGCTESRSASGPKPNFSPRPRPPRSIR